MAKSKSFSVLSKRLAALMIKSEKINEEIAEIVDSFQTELDKQSMDMVSKAPAMKKGKNAKAKIDSAKAATISVPFKKRGRPSKSKG